MVVLMVDRMVLQMAFLKVVMMVDLMVVQMELSMAALMALSLVD